MRKNVFIAVSVMVSTILLFPTFALGNQVKQSPYKSKKDDKTGILEVKGVKATVYPLSSASESPDRYETIMVFENAEAIIYTKKGKIFLNAKKLTYVTKDKSLVAEDATIKTSDGEINGQGKKIKLSLDKPHSIKIE